MYGPSSSFCPSTPMVYITPENQTTSPQVPGFIDSGLYPRPLLDYLFQVSPFQRGHPSEDIHNSPTYIFSEPIPPSRPRKIENTGISDDEGRYTPSFSYNHPASPSANAFLPGLNHNTSPHNDLFPWSPFQSTSCSDIQLQSWDSVFPAWPSEVNAHHEPIKEYQRSSYSELSAQLHYMTALNSPTLSESSLPQSTNVVLLNSLSIEGCYQLVEDPASSTQSLPSCTLNPYPNAGRLAFVAQGGHHEGTLKTANRRRRAGIGKTSFRSSSGSRCGSHRTTSTVHQPQGIEDVPQTPPGSPKKFNIACLFCRERKIACGRPPERDPDKTCNQCARRGFHCEYPKKSRRGQKTRIQGGRPSKNDGHRVDEYP